MSLREIGKENGTVHLIPSNSSYVLNCTTNTLKFANDPCAHKNDTANIFKRIQQRTKHNTWKCVYLVL